MVEVLALPHRVPSLGRAVEQFLAAKPLSANGRRSYAHTLTTVVGDLGADLPLDEFTPRVGTLAYSNIVWGDVLAPTWNNRITAADTPPPAGTRRPHPPRRRKRLRPNAESHEPPPETGL